MLRKVTLLLAVCALSIPSFSASETFAGTWKFNPEQSDANGQTIKIADRGNHELQFSIGDALVCAAPANTNVFSFILKADGIEHHTVPGVRWAITVKDEKNWDLAYKSVGATEKATGSWALSPDGNTMVIRYKGTRHDGTKFETTGTLKRVPGSKGFAGAKGFDGTWQQADEHKSSLQIDAPSEGSLAVSWPSDKVTMAVPLNGTDVPLEGRIRKGLTASAKRIDDHSIQVTQKVDGKLMATTDWKVSPDGKVLTLTEYDPSTTKATVSVYDRQ